MPKHVGDEVELARTDHAAIAAPTTLPARRTEILDVVEDDERRLAVLKRIVRRADLALPRLERMASIRAVEVHVVIAGAMVPPHAGHAEQSQIAIHETQIVTDDIAVMDRERSARLGDRRQHGVANEA